MMQRAISITNSTVLSEYIGEDAAAKLAESFGGCQLKIPKRHSGVWWDRIVAAIGQKGAEELCKAFAGESIYIPMNADERVARCRVVLDALNAGMTYAEIARNMRFCVRYSERGLRKLVAKFASSAGADEIVHGDYDSRS